MATEFAYDIELSRDKKVLTLTVELPVREFAREPILECNDNNALEIIKRDGFDNYIMVRSVGHLTNWVSREGKGGERRGEWVFQKEDAPAKATRTTTTTKKTTTSKTTTKKTTTNS